MRDQETAVQQIAGPVQAPHNEGTLIQRNTVVIREVETTFQASISDVFGSYSPGDILNCLRMMGLKCTRCAGRVTEANFRFCDYQPTVKCYDCQYK